MQINKITLIGAGGLSTHLIHSLTNIAPVHIFDGDKYEEKNITRQHFAQGNIGKNKAEVMADSVNAWAKHPVTFTPTYLTPAAVCDGDIIIAAVDNHDARLTAKEIANSLYIPLIMGMNEEYDPQAYLYLPKYAESCCDPFKYAEILPDGRDPSASCTGEIVDTGNNVQTALANTVAAGFVLAILHSLMVTPEEHEEHITAKVIGTNNTIWTKTFYQLEQEENV
jgi:molybdopterin/thiamine biosynthesis adenylyltransferase